jgi:hypothetical protein
MWTYCGEAVTSISEEHVGFVYLITNLQDGRRYIGKKLAKFSKTKIQTVTLRNGTKKKKKIRTKVDSDWPTYWSSSPELKADVARLGEENFTREILFYCNSKGTLSYVEAREQFAHRVLENPADWYNGIIQCRIHRNHVVDVPTKELAS